MWAAATSWGADGQRKLLSWGPGGWEVQISEDPLLLRIFTASSLRASSWGLSGASFIRVQIPLIQAAPTWP